MSLYSPTLEDRAIYKEMAVVIATPCKDNEVPTKFCVDVVNLVAYSWMHGLKVYQMASTESMVIHWARNNLAKRCREHVCEYTGKKFTHILWLDDDQVFSPDMLVYLARHDKDMVSSLYFGRGKHLPVAYVKDFNKDKYKHFPLVEVPAKICEVDAVGFGGLLMRREILDRLEKPWFSFNHDAGEDIYFCVHAREKGIKIYLDGSFVMGHIGDPVIVHTKQHKQFLKDNEDLLADKVKVGLGGTKHG